MATPKPKTKTKTTDKKPEPQATAAPQKRTGLTIHPDEARKALEVLAAFVDERVILTGDKARLINTVNAIKAMDSLVKFKEEVETRIKTPLENAYNHMRFTIVPSFMEDEEITTITVEDVGRVNIADDLRVTVLDKENLKEWLTDHEYEDLITDSVNAQTLAAFVRNKIKEGKTQDGKNLPTAKIMTITPFVRASITRK